MTRLPPMKALRAFEAVARRGTMTAAAQELNVTHSAISHQIASLETNLGVTLFDRVGRGVTLSDAGRELLPAVSSAFDNIAAATARMARPVSSGNLSVACMPALLSYWLMPRLGDFTDRFPGIQLTFDATSDQEQRWASGADIQILYGEQDWTGYWFKPLSELALFPVVSPSLMNTHPIRTVTDLAKHVILHADEGREWRQWLAAADALSMAMNTQHNMGDARMAIEAAVHGHGAAIGDSVTSADLLARGQLIAPFGMSVPAAGAFYIACHSDLRQLPVVNAFIDWLTSELDRDVRLPVQRSSGWTVPRGSSRSRSKT